MTFKIGDLVKVKTGTVAGVDNFEYCEEHGISPDAIHEVVDVVDGFNGDHLVTITAGDDSHTVYAGRIEPYVGPAAPSAPEEPVSNVQWKFRDEYQYNDWVNHSSGEEIRLKRGLVPDAEAYVPLHLTSNPEVVGTGAILRFHGLRPDFIALSSRRLVKVEVKAAPPEKQEAINEALDIGRGYVQARQLAWDRYAESRNRLQQGAAEKKDFFDGYSSGYHEGKRKQKAVMMALAYSAAPTTALSRAGEAEPIISDAKAGKLAELVILALQAQGPGTAAEIALRTGHPLNAVSPRMAPLKRAGLVYVSGGQRVGRGVRSIYTLGRGPL